MRFITEESLRELYKIEPFTEYELGKEERLTPGGRQYLLDRGIKIESKKEKLKEVEVEVEVEVEKNLKGKIDIKKRNLIFTIKLIETKVMLIIKDLIKEDISFGKELISLKEKLINLRFFIEEKEGLINFSIKNCTGINQDNFQEDLNDCFEITDLHMQLEESKRILLLHMIRCELRKLELDVNYAYEEEEEKLEIIIKRINAIINSLSQLICLSTGGKKCQRVI